MKHSASLSYKSLVCAKHSAFGEIQCIRRNEVPLEIIYKGYHFRLFGTQHWEYIGSLRSPSLSYKTLDCNKSIGDILWKHSAPLSYKSLNCNKSIRDILWKHSALLSYKYLFGCNTVPLIIIYKGYTLET